MRQRTLKCLVLAGLCGVGTGAPSRVETAEPTPVTVDFNRDVRPILSKNCFACHGPDGAQRAAKLRLDQRESAVKKLKSGGAAIVPGAPAPSALIRRVTA